MLGSIYSIFGTIVQSLLGARVRWLLSESQLIYYCGINHQETLDPRPWTLDPKLTRRALN